MRKAIVFGLGVILLWVSLVIVAEEVTLNVIAWPLAATEELQNDLDEFEQATGIKVNMLLLPEPVVHEKLGIEFATGAGEYDVVMLGFPTFMEFGEGGFIENLDPYVTFKAEPEWLSIDEFFPGYLDALRYEGKLYGLPMFVWGGILMYRQDILDDLGLAVPTTLDELEAAAKAVTEAYAPEMYGISERGVQGPFSTLSLCFAHSYGGEFFDKDYVPQLTSPEFVRGVSQYVRMLQESAPPGAANVDWPEVQTYLVEGKVAMAIEASDYVGRLVQSDVFPNMGYAQMPQADNPLGYMFVGGWAIPSSSRKRDEAWKFIQWSTSGAYQLANAGAITRTDFTNELVWHDPQFRTLHSAYVDTLLEAFGATHALYYPEIPEYMEVMLTYTEYVSAAIAGTYSAEEALQLANDAIYDIMEEAGYYE